MSKPWDHLKFQYAEVARSQRNLDLLKGWGVPRTDFGFQRLGMSLDSAIGKLGLVKPRITTLIRLLIGLSPGEIKLWSDAELGWLTEARAKPGATPVYKYVSDEVAEKIIKGTITPELERELLTPDVDIDN